MRFGEAIAAGRINELLEGNSPAFESENLLFRIETWSMLFHTLLSSMDFHNLSAEDNHASNILRIQHRIAWIWISTALSPSYFNEPAPESVWDAHTEGFRSIVELAEAEIGTTMRSCLTFSFEMELVIPLYLTALKCRDHVVRRRALALLSASPRREGFWDSRLAAKLAERVVEMEETRREDPSGEMGMLDLPRRSRGEKLTYSQRVLSTRPEDGLLLGLAQPSSL